MSTDTLEVKEGQTWTPTRHVEQSGGQRVVEYATILSVCWHKPDNRWFSYQMAPADFLEWVAHHEAKPMTAPPDVAALRARVADAIQPVIDRYRNAQRDAERGRCAEGHELWAAQAAAECLSLALAALSAAPAVPRDVVLLPRVPTFSMSIDGAKVIAEAIRTGSLSGCLFVAANVYAVMLAAAERGDAEGGA